jgi:hypothetical protein
MNTINWKLIFQLSLFGLAMAFASISLIPQNIEPVFWLLVMIICAYIVAKRVSTRYFLHGFLISMVNCVWITTVHILFVTTYLANHPQMISMNASLPLIMQQHQRSSMALMGPIFGVCFGLVLGLFCFIASKLVRRPVVG